MTSEQNIRLVIGDLVVQLSVANSKVEELTRENEAIKALIPPAPPSGDDLHA